MNIIPSITDIRSQKMLKKAEQTVRREADRARQNSHTSNTTHAYIKPQEPLTTLDGIFMVGDTSPTQARSAEISSEKAERMFNRIDRNDDGELSNSEICRYRENKLFWKTVKHNYKRSLPWNLFGERREKMEKEYSEILKEIKVTQVGRKTTEDEAKQDRIEHDRKIRLEQQQVMLERRQTVHQSKGEMLSDTDLENLKEHMRKFHKKSFILMERYSFFHSP